MSEYNELVAAFDVGATLAIKQATCFCLCGCRMAGAKVRNMLGHARPGLCSECTRLERSVKGHKRHHIPRNAAEAIDYVEQAAEADVEAVEPLHKRILRAISPDSRNEATDYAKHYGVEGSRFMAEMHRRVVAGNQLTDAQVDAVMASKRAETRSARAAYKRAMAEAARKGKESDLGRIVIPDDLSEGQYAVVGDSGDVVILEVKRQKDGGFRGFTFVFALMGEGVQKYGTQYPQPARDRDRFPQTYRGYMPHLVLQLVNDPARARQRYEQLLGRPV